VCRIGEGEEDIAYSRDEDEEMSEVLITDEEESESVDDDESEEGSEGEIGDESKDEGDKEDESVDQDDAPTQADLDKVMSLFYVLCNLKCLQKKKSTYTLIAFRSFWKYIDEETQPGFGAQIQQRPTCQVHGRV